MYEIIKDNKNLCVQYDLDYIVDHLLCSYEVTIDTLQQYVDVGSIFYVKWKDTNIIQSLSHIKAPKDDLLVYLLGTPYEVTYA